MVCTSAALGGGGKGIRWIRFPSDCKYGDYTYMHKTRWDAACFVPKRSVKFMGFGLLANYCGKDMKYQIMWSINDEPSEEYEVEYTDDQKDPEIKSFTVDIRNFGCKYINCGEGDKIVVKARNIYSGDDRYV